MATEAVLTIKFPDDVSPDHKLRAETATHRHTSIREGHTKSPKSRKSRADSKHSTPLELPEEQFTIASPEERLVHSQKQLTKMNNLLFPIPTWNHRVRIMQPNRDPMLSTKRMDNLNSALLLALDNKALTPYQSLKAFQKTKRLLIDQGIESKKHPAVAQED
jgi:hypothetical protein